MGINAILPNQVLANDASVGDLLTVQADGSVAFETPAAGGGIGGSTGSTDNAILRADGNGGSTLQSSSPVIDDAGNMAVATGNYLCWAQNSDGSPRTSYSARASGIYTIFSSYASECLSFISAYVEIPSSSGYTFSYTSSLNAHPSNGIYRTDDNNIRLSTFVDRTIPSAGLQVTHAQIYNTYTSSTSYERLDIDWDTNVCTIQTTAGSAGGTKRGLQIGGASTDELGFFGAAPVDQPATVADPSGGSTVDTEARAAIAAVIDRLQEVGLIA